MKYCPACQTKYDEEILRFCTKDGIPLIDENQPNFTELPSESTGDDYGEETVIRRKNPEPIPHLDPNSGDYITKVEPVQSSQRIVIPTTEEERQQIRTKTSPSARSVPPPRESNTAIVVLLTIIGTIVVLSAATGIFWILSNQNSSDNQNINTNLNPLNENINANPDADNPLFDFNSNSNGNNDNSNVNANSDSNANVKSPTPTATPTPTPTPSQTPTATPTPDDENVNTNANANVSTQTPRPTISPKPSVSPKPSASPTTPPANNPTNTPPVNAGILNDRALNLQTPSYPPIARETKASGRVQVLVTIDENGNVNSAKAVSGNPLLRSPAENTARNSKFRPIKDSGKNVKATGFVIYNFVKQN